MSRELPAWSSYPEPTYLSQDVQLQPSRAYPTYPFSSELTSLIVQLPTGFQRIVLNQAVSIKFLRIISRLSNTQAILAKTKSRSASVAELKYLHMYQPESEFQEGFDCLRCLPSDSAELEYCLCLAAMVFTNLSFNVIRFGSLWQRLRDGLTNAILDYTAKMSVDDNVLWAFLMAVWSWEGRLGLAEPGQRILKTLWAKHPFTRNWEHMKEILGHFLCTDELLKHLEKCWNSYDLGKEQLQLPIETQQFRNTDRLRSRELSY